MRWLTNFRDYAKNNFERYDVVNIENRIKLETNNYLKVLVKNKDTAKIEEFFKEFPNAGLLAMEAYVSFYQDVRTMTATWSWKGYKLIARNKYCRNILRPYAYLASKANALKNILKNKLKNLISFACYWLFALIPKNKKIWCFSGFNKKTYMDNTMYLYEWILDNHPEINAYWLTLDDKIYQKLKADGKPVLKMRTMECVKVLSRAEVAFTDHFIMSDYDNFSGFNNRIKVVQLWHGVGLKSIGDLKNTDVNGVRFSDDILSQKSDSMFTKIIKMFAYFRHAYFRELFEEYFILVCPGKERVLQIAEKWGIPKEKCFFSGHPRNVDLHKQEPSEIKILYAPTYRWNKDEEQKLINDLLVNAKEIDSLMCAKKATFVIRLHPHTWRNYDFKLKELTNEFSHIKLDDEKDVYKNLGTYSMIISDYSSIVYDFVLLDRPVIFYCPDIESFVKNECELNYDYFEYSPGPKAYSWEEVLEYIREYILNPNKDSKWRIKVREEFYDMSVNDSNNSERIVNEVKKRIGF